MRYDDVIDNLRASYDGEAADRDQLDKGAWKLAERAAFADRVRAGAGRRLLEIGAGTGQDSGYFRDQGLDVVATDLSPEMVEHCRAKGLDARVMGFLELDFPPESLDAVYAMNCLLHVPNADLPAVLETVHGMLRPGGLLFVGVYGGHDAEGVRAEDRHVPPRFFSWRSDERLQEFAVAAAFEVLDFHTLPVDTYTFQSLTLRR